MTDLKKEYGVFAEHFGLPKPNEDNPILQCSWLAWQKRAELAQAEINELKQKLEKLESGEFVLVPRELPGHIAESIINKGEFLESDPIWFGIMDTEYYKERLKDKIYELSLKHKSLIEAVEKDHE
ncbi:hypothetical protein [Acinetobacter rathckeae]|uniref:hypothetical protein n=1 Tax=Acinetobacter rathckeae TaxID=2605272 RepID=UPI0018A265EE|nr:hypothetical protein [Acinetobacter rathckeae]MBF7687041.1 hypothetical protein [Acinetobacter rathckeae]